MMKLRTCLSLNRASGGPQCGSFQRHGHDLIGSNLGKQAFRHLAFGFPIVQPCPYISKLSCTSNCRGF